MTQETCCPEVRESKFLLAYTYLRFSLSSIPEGSTINSVELRLYSYWQGDQSNKNTWLGSVGQSWSESSIAWNNRPNPASGLSAYKTFASSINVWHSWASASFPDLKSKVQAWVDGSTDNYGFMLTREQGTSGDIGYRSSEYSTSSQRPKLIIDYTPPPTGSLTVYINPADARNQGAEWKLTSGPDTSYHDSGDTIVDLPTSSYTLYFRSLSGWNRPSSHNDSITISADANSRTDTYGFNVSAPTSVSASDGTYTDRVSVTWSSSSGAEEYEVWRNTTDSSASASRIAENVPGTVFSDYSASSGQAYFYWVKAKNDAGTTGFSSSNSGYRQVGTPSAPIGVSASDGTYTDKVRVTWNSVSGATSYEVWRHTSNSSGSATRIGNSVTSTSYDDITASAGQTYYYWAKAKNAGGTSGFSSSNSGYRQDSIDTQQPTVQITSPTTAATYTSPTNRFNIGGTASDNVGVTSVKVRNFRDVGEYTCTGTESWQYSGIPLFQGLNNLSVIAYDAAGHSATDTVAVTYNSDALYDDVLRSGGVVQDIVFPDNLTPGDTATIQWKILSYVPVRCRVYARDPAKTWTCFRNGEYVGYQESQFNIYGRHAGIYSFQCNWLVPQKSGEIDVWFNVAQMDGDQYMMPMIPDGVDARPHPTASKVIQRTISPGGDGTAPPSDADIWFSDQIFEAVDQHKMRSACTVTSITCPDTVTSGAQMTCEWKILSYVPVDSQVRLVNISPAQIYVTTVGTLINTANTTYTFTDRPINQSSSAQSYSAKEYTYRATFTAAAPAGSRGICFRNRKRGDSDSEWMFGNISIRADSANRPAIYNGMYGRFIERTINP